VTPGSDGAAFKVPGDVDQAIAGAYAMPAFEEVRFASRDPQIPDAELAAWWVPAGETPEEIAADALACFDAGAESRAMVGEIHRAADPAALGWEVQRLRWRVRPPFRTG